MYTFDTETGNYNIDFGNVKKTKKKPNANLEDYDRYLKDFLYTPDDDVFSMFTNSVIVFNRDTNEYMMDSSKVEQQVSGDQQLAVDVYLKKHNNFASKLVNTAIRERNSNIKKTVLEKSPARLYDKAHMVELSYNIQDAANHIDLDAAESIFQESVNSSSLVFMRNFSSPNSAVVYDYAKKVYYVAYHGANGGGPGSEDWDAIQSVMNLKFDKHPQYLKSERDLELLLQHLGEVDHGAKVHLVGYSLGSAKSLHLAEKFNLPGTHLNAFTSPFSNYEIANTGDAMAKQEMVRIVNDPYTAQSQMRPMLHAHNRRHTNLLPLEENTSFDDAHGLDQFTSNRPRGIDNVVEKDNLLGKGLGHAAVVGGALFGGYEGFKQGEDNSGTLSEESYRGVLGAVESTLPIAGEGDLIESGLIGFTSDEIASAFHWMTDSIFGKSKKENVLPAGYVQVSGQGFSPP